MRRVDALAPEYMGEDRISLQLAEETRNPLAFRAVDILVNYEATLPEFVVLPLEFIVRAPSEGNFRRRYYTRFAPSLLTFVPQEGGTHLVLLRETAHNRWLGKLRVEVEGRRLAVSNI